eukprot:365783-Chlamydomonas_euryale.AAC.14
MNAPTVAAMAATGVGRCVNRCVNALELRHAHVLQLIAVLVLVEVATLVQDVAVGQRQDDLRRRSRRQRCRRASSHETPPASSFMQV